MAKYNLDTISLDDLYRFMGKGSILHVPEEIMYYLELLEKIYSMMRRIDKFGSREVIVKHLIVSEKAKGNEISKYKATQLYYDTLEYFYADTKVSKEAYRNMLADKLEKILNVALVTYSDAGDLKNIAALSKELRLLKQLDKEDPKIEEENRKPLTVFSINPEDVGIESIDRKELIEFVDNIPNMNEKMREKVLQDASIKMPKLLQNEQEDPYKSE